MGFLNFDLSVGDEYKVMGLSSYGKPKYYDLINDNYFIKVIQLNNLNLFNHQRKISFITLMEFKAKYDTK